ncbi:hypothetical protein TNCV_302931 [Trichonephila clavipes]|nr:hypothetical protein TNCV_302931 [Trichonephila clavipes]
MNSPKLIPIMVNKSSKEPSSRQDGRQVPTFLPNMIPNWLYRHDFAKFPLNRHYNSLVYADKPQTLDRLEDNIRRVIADIRPQMLEKVIERVQIGLHPSQPWQSYARNHI